MFIPIVERLREKHLYHHQALQEEAADEIERLRWENERLRQRVIELMPSEKPVGWDGSLDYERLEKHNINLEEQIARLLRERDLAWAVSQEAAKKKKASWALEREVERLRADIDTLHNSLNKAEEEIERLRTGCPFSNPCQRYRGLLTDIDLLQKEVERLRAALARYTDPVVDARNQDWD